VSISLAENLLSSDTLGGQSGCPIKHARRALRTHPFYGEFVDYGDAEAYCRELHALRADITRLDAEAKKQQSET